jgi:methyltransferase (TIGR00027 family)
VRQYVVLGAGLDTFAHRNPYTEQGLRVFEVDHPATQAWKRARLADAGMATPASLTFAPVDFEHQTLADGLAAAGFDAAAPAFFAWLGVVVYLTRAAVMETLGFIAGLPGGAEVVFDYGEPASAYPPDQRAAQTLREARMAAIGEPWKTRFMPDQLEAELRGLGFDTIEDLGPAAISRQFYGLGRADGPGGHLVRAGRATPWTRAVEPGILAAPSNPEG